MSLQKNCTEFVSARMSAIDDRRAPLLRAFAAASGIDLDVPCRGATRQGKRRISTVVSNLKAIGAQAEERRDGFRYRSAASVREGSPLTATIVCNGVRVVGWLDGNDIDVDDRDCVGISYPNSDDVAALVK